MPNLHHEKLIGYLQVIKFIGTLMHTISIPDMSGFSVLQRHCLNKICKKGKRNYK